MTGSKAHKHLGWLRSPPIRRTEASDDPTGETMAGTVARPTVTVVTPTFNGAAFLIDCIQSVRRNHHAEFDVDHVVVDAGSTDGTVEIAREHGLRLLQGKDQGIFDAINKGSFNSSGDLLGFLGSDDVMLDGALAAIVDVQRRTGAGWIVGGIRWIGNHGEDLGGLAPPPSWMTARMQVCLGWNPVMHMSTYITRPMFERLKGFDIGYKDAGDYELFARALREEPFARIARPLACFRRTGANNSVVNTARSNAECGRILESYGPKSRWERSFWRWTLKAWFNLGNPGWLLRKLSGAVRCRLDPQGVRYF